MEWRDGKLQISLEDQAELLRDMAQFGKDGETRAELRRAARETSARAADPARPPVIIERAVIGGRAVLRRNSHLARLLDGGRDIDAPVVGQFEMTRLGVYGPGPF